MWFDTFKSLKNTGLVLVHGFGAELLKSKESRLYTESTQMAIREMHYKSGNKLFENSLPGPPRDDDRKNYAYNKILY
jgi:hypothetical protein